jgi:hypothetical protein
VGVGKKVGSEGSEKVKRRSGEIILKKKII